MNNQIIQDVIYPEMYRIQWDDGKVSDGVKDTSDMVNLTRARDAVARYEESRRSKTSRRVCRASRKAVGAFK